MTNPSEGPGQASTVLLLHPGAEYSAADRTLLQLVRSMDRERWTPVVVLPRRGPLIGALEQADVTVEVGPLGVTAGGFGRGGVLRALLSLPLCLFFVRRMIHRHRAKVVHTHTGDVLGGAIAARLFARRHVWHLHRTLASRGLAARWRARLASALADVVACGSESARESLEALRPGLADKTRLVRGAIDMPLTLPGPEQREREREAVGVYDDATLLLVVGRIEPGGGQRLVMEAIKSLRYSHPDVRAVFVGDPSRADAGYTKAIDDEIKGGSLEGVVQRLPYKRDLTGLYAAADVVCIPGARIDPLHMVSLEAMAARKPVIAAEGPGVDEYLAPGTSALTFPAGDVERLAWCIGTLAADPNRRASMGEAAAALHAERFQAGRLRNEFDRAWSRAVDRSFELPASRASIVHFVLGKANPERLNGINHAVHHLATTQARAGLDVRVFGLTADPEAPTPPREYGTAFFPKAGFRFRLSEEVRGAIAALDTTAMAHLHGAYLPEMVAIGKELRRQRVPFVVTPHGGFLREVQRRGRLRKWLWIRLFERRHLARAQAVQVFSGRELVDMESLVDLETLHVVPNGQEALETPPAPDPAELDEVKRPLLCYCGRLAAHTKGLDALLSGFARHVARRGAGHLWLIGDGKDRASLEAQAEELGISRRVRFLGARFGEEKRSLLSAADAFVHPSRHEGMPTAVLEAGALGLPLMVSPGTNLHQEVRRAQAGFVVPEVTPEAIAETLADIEAEHGRGSLPQTGAHARWFVQEWFSWPRVAAQVSRELYGLDDAAPQAAADPGPAAAPPPLRDSA